MPKNVGDETHVVETETETTFDTEPHLETYEETTQGIIINRVDITDANAISDDSEQSEGSSTTIIVCIIVAVVAAAATTVAIIFIKKKIADENEKDEKPTDKKADKTEYKK